MDIEKLLEPVLGQGCELAGAKFALSPDGDSPSLPILFVIRVRMLDQKISHALQYTDDLSLIHI